MKKILTMMLALLMLVAPMAALAQAVPCDASLVISDPVFTFGDNPENAVTTDLTGLALAINLATTAEVPGMTIDLSANGETAFSAVVEKLGDQFVGTLSGMTMGVKIAADEAFSMASGSVPSSALDIGSMMGTFETFVSSISFEDAGTAEAEFFGGGRLTAHKQDFVVSKEAYATLMKQIMQIVNVELPEDFSAEAVGSFYMSDDQKHQRFEMTYTFTFDEETVTFPATILTYVPTDDSVYASLNCVVEDTTIDGNFMTAPIEGIDASNLFADLTITEDGQVLGSIQLTSWAEETADGLKKLFNFTVADPSSPVRVQGSSLIGDNAVSYDLLVQADGDTSHIAFNGVPVSADGKTGVSGTLSLNLGIPEGKIVGTMGVTATTGGMVDLPDLSCLTLVDAANITEEEMVALQTEAQTLLFRGLGQLMSIPGLQAVMADLM